MKITIIDSTELIIKLKHANQHLLNENNNYR